MRSHAEVQVGKVSNPSNASLRRNEHRTEVTMDTESLGRNAQGRVASPRRPRFAVGGLGTPCALEDESLGSPGVLPRDESHYRHRRRAFGNFRNKDEFSIPILRGHYEKPAMDDDRDNPAIFCWRFRASTARASGQETWKPSELRTKTFASKGVTPKPLFIKIRRGERFQVSIFV
jgi:hypothetical protein